MKQIKNGIAYTPDSVIIENLREIQQIRFLSESTFVIRFNRDNLQFKAGQFLAIGTKDSMQQREYSIYSGDEDDYLEILVREITNGNVSQLLKQCEVGQSLMVTGPLGLMMLNDEDINTKRFVFIASGTGIAPFHSFVTSYPTINYNIIHGVRFINEAYDKADYDPLRYFVCTSRENSGNYYGRVTGFLKDYLVEPDMLFYLCGNSSMIYEVYDILKQKGVPIENIKTEVYF